MQSRTIIGAVLIALVTVAPALQAKRKELDRNQYKTIASLWETKVESYKTLTGAFDRAKIRYGVFCDLGTCGFSVHPNDYARSRQVLRRLIAADQHFWVLTEDKKWVDAVVINPDDYELTLSLGRALDRAKIGHWEGSRNPTRVQVDPRDLVAARKVLRSFDTPNKSARLKVK